MKTSVYFPLAFAFASAVAFSAQAAGTGTITFNGELTGSTCNAVIDGSTADATVTLPTIGINELTTAGDTAGRTGFTINLSGCTGSLKNAAAFFEAGSTVDVNSGHLKNSGTAGNVSLQLLEEAGSEAVIKAGSSSQSTDATFYDVSGGSADLPYAVEYYADDTTTAGTVTSKVIYSIQYN